MGGPVGNRNAVGNRGNPYGRRGRNGTERNVDVTRKKIQVSLLIRRLQDHVFDRLKKPLDATQVRAIDILLKKCIPDLMTATITADLNVHYVVQLPDVLDKAEWIKKYGDPRQIEGTTNGSGTVQ